MRKLFAAASLFLITIQAFALDVYIGTLETKNGKVILTRCDLVMNRYVLLDETKNPKAPIKDFLQKFEGEKTRVYGEVFGNYEERDGNNILIVKAIENIQKNKTCHLLDLLDNHDHPGADTMETTNSSRQDETRRAPALK